MYDSWGGNIDISSRFITLIGTPLSQSYAAQMQNRAYRDMGLNIRYFYTETGSEHLQEIINGIRYMPSFIGCAVTKPNKVRVMEYLDEVDVLCERIGACNTVVKLPDGCLKGYNTDAMGFLQAMKQEAGISAEGMKVFCFGAGGASRAICMVLAYYGAAKIGLTDVYEPSAIELADRINCYYPGTSEYTAFGACTSLDEYDMIINATGVGMGKTIGQSPMAEKMILPDAVYFDACYNPVRTQFLQNAEAKGFKTYNGLMMSLYQGVEQIRLWTGKEPPVEVMREAIFAQQIGV